MNRALDTLAWTTRGWTDTAAPLVPAADLAVQHGFGFFETLRAYNGRLFRAKAHFDRMSRSAREFRVKLPVTAGDFESRARELLAIRGLTDARVRLTVTAGPPPLAVIQAWPCDAPPERVYTRGISLWPCPWRRNTRGALSGHKTLNYLENLRARTEAQRRGHFEALMLNERDELAEGTRANLFFVRERRVFTPALSCGILAGVTRAVVREIVASRGRRVEEGTFTAEDLLAADEAFISSTIVEVLPVVRVGARRIGAGRPGPLTRALRRAFRAVVARETRE